MLAVQFCWWGGGVEATVAELGSTGPQIKQLIWGMEEADLPCQPSDQQASYRTLLT